MPSRLWLAFALLVWLASGCGSPPPTRSNVVLIVADTLRKDHLGAYGHTRPTTPNVDSLAASATRYTRAFSQASWTTPSVAALLTSQYPSRLDILDVPHRLKSDFELLPEVLQANGYVTGGIISHDFLGSEWNFDQGYDEFYEELAQGHYFVSSPQVTDRAIDFIDRHLDQPFFLLVHYFDPHHVYRTHDGFDFATPLDYQGGLRRNMTLRALRERDEDSIEKTDVDYLEALYDSDVAFTDHHIGRLLDHLRQTQLFDSSFLVFTADHGEEFFDHRSFGHALTLYDEVIAVPLIVKYPNQEEPSVSPRLVGLIDVFPTIVDLLDISPSRALSGESLLAEREQAQRPAERTLFSETSRHGLMLRAAIRSQYKLIADLGQQQTMLFDLDADPGEQRNLAGGGEPAEVSLQQDLTKWITSASQTPSHPENVEMQEELLRRLRALGYVE